MTSKTYLNILKWGACLAPFCLLLVFPALLFPYITSKQLVFNILIEVLTLFWLLLVLKYPNYRPSRSWITLGLLAYFGFMLISCLIGVDFNLSFFGNAERMLGWFHLFHFFLFYLIIITAWREKKDWLRFLDVSIAVSVIVVLYGLKQNYPASFLGNAAYVGALMLFALGFAIYRLKPLAFKNLKALKENYNWLYLVAIPFLFYGLIRANISGAYVGLAAGIVGGILLWSFLSPQKAQRRLGIASVIALVVIVAALFFGRNSALLKNSSLGLALKDFSASNPTWNTRLISWHAAYLDFKDHPLLGVGHGNYAFIFDYYFEPRFLDYSPNETYFDRAHNNLVDIISTTGTLGLLAYLSIFVALGYYLVKAYQKKKIKSGELSIFCAIIIAYFVQNLALFDALVTYIMFFALLGMAYFYSQDYSQQPKDEVRFSGWKEYLLGGVLALFFIASIWCLNVQGFKMFSLTLKGYAAISEGEAIQGMDYYERAVNLAPYNRDSRATLVNLIAGNSQYLSYLDQKTAIKVLDMAVTFGQENVAYNPYDSMMNSQLARIANLAARYNFRDLEKLNKYSAIAVGAIEQAIASSPKRYPLYFTRADVYLTRAEEEEVIASLNKIKELKPDNQEVNCQFANTYFFFEKYDLAYDFAAQCALSGKAKYLSYDDLIKQAAADQAKKGNNEAAEKLNEVLAK